MNIENFEHAFDSGCCGCRRTCECGQEFWDGYNSGYTWEDGEREALEKNPKAIRLPHAVGTISLEGSEYVMDCTCWHERAKRIMGFLDSHLHAIAKYFMEEKKRKQAEVDSIPLVEIEP